MIETDSLYRRISIRILPILFCCYLVNYVDRVNVSFAQLRISASLGIGPAAYGFGAGLFFIGYFFLQVPSNLFLHRIGARNCMSLIVLLWGVVSASTAFVRNEWDFYVLRFLLGACRGRFFPGRDSLPHVVVSRGGPRPRGGLFLTAIPVAGLLGGPASGWILENVRGSGLQDWQWLFILEGAPCVLVALWVFRCLPDHPRDARWLAEADRRRLDAALQKESLQRAATGSAADSAAKAFLHPAVWKLCLLYFCTMMGLYGLTFWLPQVIQALGWSGALQIGLLSAIPWLVAVVFMLLLGARSDRKQERRCMRIRRGGRRDRVCVLRLRPERPGRARGRFPGRRRHHGNDGGPMVSAEQPARRLGGRRRDRARQFIRKPRRLRQPDLDRADYESDRASNLGIVHNRGRTLVCRRPVRLFSFT